ncbi:MAG: hypothetical protein AB7I79_13365 [Rhizobiaceae bacterium]
MPFTLKNIAIGVICIVAMSLLAEAFRVYVYDVPVPTWLEQAFVTAIAVVIWFAIAARMKR